MMYMFMNHSEKEQNAKYSVSQKRLLFEVNR